MSTKQKSARSEAESQPSARTPEVGPSTLAKLVWSIVSILLFGLAYWGIPAFARYAFPE